MDQVEVELRMPGSAYVRVKEILEDAGYHHVGVMEKLDVVTITWSFKPHELGMASLTYLMGALQNVQDRLAPKHMLVVPEDRVIRAEIRADTAEREVRKLRKLAKTWMLWDKLLPGESLDQRLDYLISVTPDDGHEEVCP